MEEPCDLATWVKPNREFHAIFSEVDKTSRLVVILNGLRDSAAAHVALSLRARPNHIAQ